MSGLEVVAGIGLAAQTYGQIKTALDQADAARKNAEMKDQQATELLQREAINENLMREQGQRAADQYQVQSASTGLEGAGIGGAIEIHRRVEESIANSNREAVFKARMLKAGAEMDTKLSSDLTTAGLLTGTGTLLRGGADIYLRNQPSTKAPSLPEVPS